MIPKNWPLSGIGRNVRRYIQIVLGGRGGRSSTRPRQKLTTAYYGGRLAFRWGSNANAGAGLVAAARMVRTEEQGGEAVDTGQ